MGIHMQTRTIYLKHYRDLESLKLHILQKLLLVDQSKDSVAEFHDRLKHYLERNRNQELVFRVDRAEIERKLRFDIRDLLDGPRPLPKGYEPGNPHNRWIWDGSEGARTEEETRLANQRLQEAVEARITALHGFLSELRLLGGGRIVVLDR